MLSPSIHRRSCRWSRCDPLRNQFEYSGFDGDWLVPGQHVTSIVSSNVGLLKRGLVNEMRREIDDRTLERADILMTNVWGQEELDKTAVFWKPPSIVRSWPERLSMPARSSAVKRTLNRRLSNNLLQKLRLGIGAAAIGGLIYDTLSKQGKGLVLDFNPFEYFDDSWTGE